MGSSGGSFFKGGGFRGGLGKGMPAKTEDDDVDWPPAHALTDSLTAPAALTDSETAPAHPLTDSVMTPTPTTLPTDSVAVSALTDSMAAAAASLSLSSGTTGTAGSWDMVEGI